MRELIGQVGDLRLAVRQVRVEGVDRLRGVHGVGAGDDHGVDLLDGQQFLVVAEGFDAVFLPQLVAADLIGVGDGDEDGVGVGEALGDVPPLRNGAAPDHTILHRHVLSSSGELEGRVKR